MAEVMLRQTAHPLKLATVAVMAFMLSGCSLLGIFIRPSQIRVADPDRAVKDARTLIEEHRRNHDRLPFYEPHELPESLKIRRLYAAWVFDDHLDLVLYSDPDVRIGARIWSLDSKRQHRDQPTKYPEIFFFFYDNDYPESPDNIP